MGKRSKRYGLLEKKVDRTKTYSLETALDLLKELHSAKFDETVSLSVKLGLDLKKLQQPVRGSVVLPHGTGKKIKILVFTQGENVEKAKQSGADFVGGAELVDRIKEGWMDFDAVVATPDMMKTVAPLGKTLGPRGLMPSPKTGTVTFELDRIISELRKGRVDFKMDRDGNIQFPVGRISFDVQKLKENAAAALEALNTAKPSGAKGTYIRSTSLSLTMSPAVRIAV